MTSQRMPQRRSLRLNIGFAALVTYFTMACGTGQTTQVHELPVAVVTVSGEASTTIPSAYATSYAQMTRIALWKEEVRTRVALTPTEPLPTRGPWESPTPILGLDSCTNANTHEPQMLGCWRGVVNGEIIGVAGGREGSFDDPMQGLVMVFHGPRFDPTAPTTEIYKTPQRVGPIRLIAVDGMLFTFVSIPGYYPGAKPTPEPTPIPQITFVFDLATRQWVSLPPIPSVSPVISPVPSISVVPMVSPSILPIASPSIAPVPSPSVSP